ncbi:hypothetical protein [Thaumasiovibrio sp. DFM-14]|uniref:hypothetical protein n=1 Tax=Thaumasiovibrio sp. DFM-14 TaxID=3384792 RepID=UPI0039A1FDCB
MVMKSKCVRFYINISGVIFFSLAVSFVALLIIDVCGVGLFPPQAIDKISWLGKVFVVFFPIPLLLYNLYKGTITWPRFAFAIVVLALLAWRFKICG